MKAFFGIMVYFLISSPALGHFMVQADAGNILAKPGAPAVSGFTDTPAQVQVDVSPGAEGATITVSFNPQQPTKKLIFTPTSLKAVGISTGEFTNMITSSINGLSDLKIQIGSASNSSDDLFEIETFSYSNTVTSL